MMINYLKMPPPLVVLGGFYILVALIHFVTYLRDGYWHGILNGLRQVIIGNLVKVGIIVIITLLLIFTVDKPVTQLCQRYYNQNLYTALDFICSMAEGWFIGGVIFTCLLISSFLKNRSLTIVLRISFMASFYAGLVNVIIKLIFNRERPSIGLEPLNFFHFFAIKDKNFFDLFYAYNSMASGHTITIFAAITPLILYSKHKSYQILLICFGLVVGFSRIYTINHWLSDVYVAAVLGILIGSISYKVNAHRLNNQ